MCGDIVELRKCDHSAERLQIDRERLKLEKEKSEEQICEKVAKLVKQSGRNGERLSNEERERRMREIFGLPPETKRKGGLSAEALAVMEKDARPHEPGISDGAMESSDTRVDEAADLKR